MAKTELELAAIDVLRSTEDPVSPQEDRALEHLKEAVEAARVEADRARSQLRKLDHGLFLLNLHDHDGTFPVDCVTHALKMLGRFREERNAYRSALLRIADPEDALKGCGSEMAFAQEFLAETASSP